MQDPILVAIGGFRLHSPVLFPVFQLLAVPSFLQARNAPGNLLTDARYVDGRHFSLSAWSDPRSMRTYAQSGAHARALRASRWLGAGPFTFFTAQELPSWEQALETWRAEHVQLPLSPSRPAR